MIFFLNHKWLFPFQKDLYCTGAITRSTHGKVQVTGKSRKKKILFVSQIQISQRYKSSMSQ